MDLMICLLSGGASALWAAPVPGVSLGELRATTDALMRAGAPIAELNTVRKHLSRIAGGQLALASGAGEILTLAVSDVLGSPPEVIGSGPTVPDPTTFSDALHLIRERRVSAPERVIRYLQRGAAGEVPDTPKPSHPRWTSSTYHILLAIDHALRAARAHLLAAGYEAEIVSSRLEGEARVVATRSVERAAGLARQGARRRALIWGGESTVTVSGKGAGGPCQEMAMAAAIAIDGDRRLVVGCLATDGTDGPTAAAGGIVDGTSVARMTAKGLDPRKLLAENDASAGLTAVGDIVVTGPTGTNVNDLMIILLD
jgi:glycerate 2-kinase